MGQTKAQLLNEVPFWRLSIETPQNQTLSAVIDDEPVEIQMREILHNPGHMDFSIRFILPEPVRFQVDFLLPTNCVNACATLNGGRLVGWFSDHIPPQESFRLPPSCDQGNDVSTLCPGEIQSLNFPWRQDDELVFHLFYLIPSESGGQ